MIKNEKRNVISVIEEKIGSGEMLAPVVIEVNSTDFNSDAQGNDIAHFQAFAVDASGESVFLCESGRRRAKIGSTGHHEGALKALSSMGIHVNVENCIHTDGCGYGRYTFPAAKAA